MVLALPTMLVVAVPLLCGMARAEQPSGMSYLDNGQIRLGVNLDLGGAITWLSLAGSDDNVVNSWDHGRQIQMSFYSGPIPFVVGDKRPSKHWEQLGWNPVQAGDDFGHGSRVVEFRNDGRQIYVECIPLQWPLDNVPGDCTFRCWLELQENRVLVRARLNNRRVDRTTYPAARQELPAVYTNGPLHRLISYRGPRPFTGDEVSEIKKVEGEPGPWANWRATERWAALVRDDDWGLGIWNPDAVDYTGGFAGQPGQGGPRDAPTGYMSPTSLEMLDHDIEFTYRYVLILGKIDEIRRFAVQQAQGLRRVDYRFSGDRQHWHLANAHDSGWPINGELRVALDQADPQLIGPVDCWQAADVPRLLVRAAYSGAGGEARIFFKRFDDRNFSEDCSVTFSAVGDGVERDYEVTLAGNPAYRGTLVGLRFDPLDEGVRGATLRLKAIAASGAK